MKKKNFNILSLFLLFFSVLYGNVFAQGMSLPGSLPGISPAMLSQISTMSPDQRRALAEQYGINLDDFAMGVGIGTSDAVGSQSNELVSDGNEILIERILESQDNTNKAEQIRKNNIPLFQQDYSLVENLPIFGKFLFDGKFSTFSPIDNIPVPNDYVMGPGDSLEFLMYGTKDSRIQLTINRDGSINFPELGNLNVSGMTFSEVSDYIKTRVSREMLGTEVSISVGRLRSINVFLTGEANIPGMYSVSGLSTVSQLLFVAGGITDIGSLRNIQIRRSNETVAIFDLYELLTEGNAENDIRLRSGDVIFIPTIHKSVYIDGAVRRTAKYELKEDDRLSDLISLAGGLESRAYKKQIYIERYDNNTDVPMIINLDLSKPENYDFLVSDGDIIRIAKISDQLTKSVMLSGAVKRPGRYGWYEGIRFSDILSDINTDFLSDFDTNKSLIIRRKNTNNYDIEVIDFNIKEALSSPGSDMDPSLSVFDEILIFSQGHNNDNLNNIEIYNPSEDIEHPLYGKEEEIEEEVPQNLSAMRSLEDSIDPRTGKVVIDQMTKEELRIATYEMRKEAEYDLINRGKRRLLLEKIISKLSQQASSADSVKTVSISGAVKVPGQYPLTNNASYMDLVDLAGGFKDNAYIESAEIRETMFDTSGSMIIETSNINLKELSDTLVKSRDHLHIRSVKDWNASDTVMLTGEVFYPGSYLIGPNETLSSVIKRAGGFTNESFIRGAIFTRESIKQKEREQLRILGDTIRRDQAARSMTKESEDFSVSSTEVEAGIEALMSSEVYGRLIIDIPSILSGDSSADIVLQDGDHLTIPKYTNAVTVVGEVRRSGSFVRQDSYNIDDYLDLAAGMTARGDSKEIYVIGADGSVRKNIKQTSLLMFDDGSLRNIQAGDTIVVPIKSSYQTPLNLYSTVSQVVFQSIASIAAFSTVFD